MSLDDLIKLKAFDYFINPLTPLTNTKTVEARGTVASKQIN